MTSLSPPHKLERFGVRALHEQLSDRLREFATSAERGERLPTEEELVALYKVSRVTVRRAIETLVDEGLLVRRQGRGTFVGQQRVQSLDRLRPFVDAFGDDPGVEARLIEFGWTSGDEVPETLGGPDGQVLAFQRLYLSEGSPHALVRVMVPEAIGRRIERAQLESHPIYHVLQNELALKLREARIGVTCEPADADVAAQLQIPVGRPLLVLERTTVDVDGDPVETATHYLLPDVYELQLTVDGGALPPLIRLPSRESGGSV
jgi:GntR family transcriptional regulator